MNQADAGTLEELRRLLDTGDDGALRALIESLSPTDQQWLFGHLRLDEVTRLLEAAGPELSAEILDEAPSEQVASALGSLVPEDAAQIVRELETDEQADVLSLMPPPMVETILTHMGTEEAAVARELLAYPPDTAGGLMVAEVLRFHLGVTVQDVLAELQDGADRYSDYDVQYAYVVDDDDKLRGVLRLRDLLFAGRSARVEDIMIPDPLRVHVTDGVRKLRGFFEDSGFVGAPAVDDEDRLLGVVRRYAVEAEIRRQMSGITRKISGIIGGEELRSMPFHQRAGRRLGWLSANIVLNVLAASVIAAHQDTLSAAIILAVFLPMISDMSGCSGNQAVAVSLRELTLGVLRPGELGRVLGKELAVGVVNGLALGLLLGLLAAVWKQNVWLGLVVGGALALNTVVSACLGGVVPLLLRRLRIDPAVASGPLLTTVTDVCGFFLVLTLAGSVLDRLG